MAGDPLSRFEGRALRPALADAAALWRTTSAGVVAGKAARRARAVVSSEESLIELRKDLGDVVPAPGPSPLRLAVIDASRLDDLHDLNRRRCASRKTRRFAGDLRRGCHGFVAYRGAVAVGYYWWATGEAAATHRDLRRIPQSVVPAPGEVYGFDLFLLDDARGANVAAHFLHGVETALRELGHARLWGYVDAGNRPARWLYATRGYRPTRRIEVRSRLGYRSHQVSVP